MGKILRSKLPKQNSNKPPFLFGWLRVYVSYWQRWSLPVAYKFALGLAWVVVLGMGILGSVVVSYQSELMGRQIEEYGATIVSQYAASAKELVFTDNQFGLQVLTANLVSDPRILGAAIYEDNKDSARAHAAPRVQAGEVPRRGAIHFAEQAESINGNFRALHWQRKTYQGNEQLVSYLTPVSFQGVVAAQALVTFSHASVSFGFQQTIRTLVLVTIGIMLLSLALAYWMSQRLARPIKQLVAATDELRRGNYQVQLTEKRGDEFGQLIRAVNRMANSLREKHQVEGVLSRVVADDVAKKMLSHLDSVKIGSERVEASVLFVDIAGFTPLAESASPEAVVELLNEYFTYFTQCSRLFFGTVDKFIGDCAMVIFGAPRPSLEHRFNAIACAVIIQRLLNVLNERRKKQGLREIKVRIGINSGEMMAGIIGTQERMEYTVVGDSVNLASRLSTLAEPGEIIIGDAVYQHADTAERVMVEPFKYVNVKGKTHAVKTYKVIGIESDQQRIIETMIDDICKQDEIE